MKKNYGQGLFDEWSSNNEVIADYRSRFDDLRNNFPLYESKADAERLLILTGWAERYPLLPDDGWNLYD